MGKKRGVTTSNLSGFLPQVDSPERRPVFWNAPWHARNARLLVTTLKGERTVQTGLLSDRSLSNTPTPTVGFILSRLPRIPDPWS